MERVLGGPLSAVYKGYCLDYAVLPEFVQNPTDLPLTIAGLPGQPGHTSATLRPVIMGMISHRHQNPRLVVRHLQFPHHRHLLD